MAEFLNAYVIRIERTLASVKASGSHTAAVALTPTPLPRGEGKNHGRSFSLLSLWERRAGVVRAQTPN
jgi:hypothetical protein